MLFMPPAVPSAQSMCGTTYTYAVLAPFTDETGDAVTLLNYFSTLITKSIGHRHMFFLIFPPHLFRALTLPW